MDAEFSLRIRSIPAAWKMPGPVNRQQLRIEAFRHSLAYQFTADDEVH
jgi:hypothetical protein